MNTIIKGWVKNIVVVFMSLLIVVSTNGINVFIHHCNCSHSETISISDDNLQSCCQTDIVTECHINEPETQSCCSTGAEKIKHDCNYIHNCCKIIHKYFKLEARYLISYLNISFEIIDVIADAYDNIIEIEEDTHFKNIDQYLYSLPPILIGKELLHFLNKLKIDIPVIS